MAAIVPMLGAVLAHVKTPKSVDKKTHPKPRGKRTTKGEKSVAEPAQQHGELASAATPERMPSDRHMIRERAKSEKRHATESWISGHMTTEEHNAVHRRADHVLSGRHPREFKGKTGERKIKF